MRCFRGSLSCLAIVCFWSGSGVALIRGADIHWNGNGSGVGGANSESWQNVDNWDPFGSPFSTHRVPGDGDIALLTNPFSDTVRLFGNTALIDGMTLSHSNRLHTNGHLLEIDKGGFQGAGTAAIAGINSTLFVEPRAAGSSFRADNLLLSGGGQLIMAGGDAVIEGNTTLGSSSQIIDNLSSSTAQGEITFGGDLTLFDSTVNLPDVEAINFLGGSRVQINDGSSMTLWKPLTIDNGIVFEVNDFDSELVSKSSVTIGPTGRVSVDGGDFISPGFLLVDGGVLEFENGGELDFGFSFGSDGIFFRAQNNGQVTTTSSLNIKKTSTFSITSGADLTVSGSLFLGDYISDFIEPSSLVVEGDGTTLNAASLRIGSRQGDPFGPGPHAKFRDHASGIVDNLSIANASGIVGWQGTLSIFSGATLEVTGPVHVAAVGSAANRGFIFVSTGGAFTQSGNGTTQIGRTTDSSGRIFVSEGGTYTSNTQNFEVDETGRLSVSGGTVSGLMTIQGPLTVKGEVQVNASSGPDDPGGILRVTAPMNIDGGTVTLNGGSLSAASMSFQNSGSFDFAGGKLSVGIFSADLINSAGTLAPGPAATESGAADTAIIGDYTQLTNAALEIEIGGTAMGTEYDFVDVANNAALDGDLELALISDFFPDAADTFIILNAGNLLGSFDNIGNGGRLDTLNGLGSFLVHYGVASSFNPEQIVLSDFEVSLTADRDNDGDVDGNDFLLIQRTAPSLIPLWQMQYGSAIAANASTAVPEPSTLLLACIAAAFLSRRMTSEPF